MEKIEEIANSVLRSVKYKHVMPELVARLTAKEFAKREKFKEATKAVKNKLHQIGGAYLEKQPDYRKLLKNIKESASEAGGESLRAELRRAMDFHASTAERLPFLEEFYKQIFKGIAPPRRVLDLACGLNPLARPWMGLPEETEFMACDIFSDMMKFLEEVFKACHWKGEAFAVDLLSDAPLPVADVVLILKTIPCLEQVEKEASIRLLSRVNAKHVIISFPGKSLGGREKGMRVNYAERFLKLLEGTSWEVRNMVIGEELLFILSR
ncbi:MAG: hypothetical protein FJY98_00675 [Candidatus Liptonbacteria bacterium]|nr:hypothetical protein [Candidatus Liptonbacteria bacterium]